MSEEGPKENTQETKSPVDDKVLFNIEAIIDECLQTNDSERLLQLKNEGLITYEQFLSANRTIEVNKGNQYTQIPIRYQPHNNDGHGMFYGTPEAYDQQYKKTIKMYTRVIICGIGYLIPIVNVLVLPLAIYLLVVIFFGTFNFPNEIYRSQFKSIRIWWFFGYIPIIGWPIMLVAVFKAVSAKSRLNENMMQYRQTYNMRNFYQN